MVQAASFPPSGEWFDLDILREFQRLSVLLLIAPGEDQRTVILCQLGAQQWKHHLISSVVFLVKHDCFVSPSSSSSEINSQW